MDEGSADCSLFFTDRRILTIFGGFPSNKNSRRRMVDSFTIDGRRYGRKERREFPS
jgi:hypothetical protein